MPSFDCRLNAALTSRPLSDERHSRLFLRAFVSRLADYNYASSHEFVTKKRRNERRKERTAATAAAQGGAAEQNGDKRQRR